MCVTKLQVVLVLFLIIWLVVRDSVRDQVASGFGFDFDYLVRWYVTMCV